MSHKGSILALPTGIHEWPVARPDEIDEQSLVPSWQLPIGRVKIFFFGLGTQSLILPLILPLILSMPLRQAFIRRGIRCEVMTTLSAARIYTICATEYRPVGAALIAVL